MIKPHHFQEWVGSAVDPEIISLNVLSLSGDNAYERLLYGLPHSERRNDGRLRDGWLKRYAHLDHGGWWCGGIDILIYRDSLWGCFKPDIPSRALKKTADDSPAGENDRVIGIYCDGSGTLRLPGGWGVAVLFSDGQWQEFGGYCATSTTNQRMELMGAIGSLQYLAARGIKNPVPLFSDSKYVVQGISYWIKGWKANNWLTREGNPVANRDLWEKLDDLNAVLKVKFKHVKGHSGIEGNERADKIAVTTRHGARHIGNCPFDRESIDVHETVKSFKYEHPAKVPAEIFALRVPDRVWQEIADRHGQNPYCPLPTGEDSLMLSPLHRTSIDKIDKDIEDSLLLSPLHTHFIYKDINDLYGVQFWQWVIDANLPITITEGAKKAGALLTAGYVAIALPGIFNGYRQEKDERGNKIGLPYLIPQLLPFATPRREIGFCFDRDTKIETVFNARTAIEKTGKLFSFKGCKVSVIEWPDDYKGVDDLIAARGQDYFETLYKDREPLNQWKLKSFTLLKPDLIIDHQFIPQSLAIPEKTQLIAIKSGKGTGKTEWIAHQIAPRLARGERVIAIGHREQLMKELSRRFGVNYRTELKTSEDGSLFGYCLCIDSLHPNANPRFNPTDWEGATVVIDEVEQVIWHLLNSPTCQPHRVPILETLKELLQTVVTTKGKIYLADADLTAISIKYIKGLIGFPVAIYIVENEYKRTDKRVLKWFEGNDPSALVNALEKAISQGEKPFILTDGQKHKSTWGTRNLEHHLKQKFPHLKILRIDRESVGDKNHPAFGCMGNLNEILPLYDVVIASPTIETGVSIDIKHFDSVWGISHGVQTLEGFCQGLERVRADIPRYIWVKEYSPNRIGNGSIDLKQVLASEHKLTRTNIALLQKAGLNEFDDLGFIEDESPRSPSLMAWAKRGCILNCQNKELRKNIQSKLAKEGYEVSEFEDFDDDECEGTKGAVQASKEGLNALYKQSVIESESLTNTEFEKLKEARAFTEDERDRLRRGTIERLYLTENITEELITRDDDDWYPKIRLQYFLTVGCGHLVERDRKSLAKAKVDGDGKIFKPDVNKSQLLAKIETLKLKIIGIEQFFDSDREFTSDSLREWFDRLNNPITASHLRAILGISISPKDTPVAFVQRLLGLLGLKLTFDRQEQIDGRRERYYKGANPDPDGRGEVFTRWLERDELGNCRSLKNVA